VPAPRFASRRLGFSKPDLRDAADAAWTLVLEQLDEKMRE
jgi:hypothetical protein